MNPSIVALSITFLLIFGLMGYIILKLIIVNFKSTAIISSMIKVGYQAEPDTADALDIDIPASEKPVIDSDDKLDLIPVKDMTAEDMVRAAHGIQ